MATWQPQLCCTVCCECRWCCTSHRLSTPESTTELAVGFYNVGVCSEDIGGKGWKMLELRDLEETSSAQPGPKTKQRPPRPKKLCNRSFFTTKEKKTDE